HKKQKGKSGIVSSPSPDLILQIVINGYNLVFPVMGNDIGSNEPGHRNGGQCKDQWVPIILKGLPRHRYIRDTTGIGTHYCDSCGPMGNSPTGHHKLFRGLAFLKEIYSHKKHDKSIKNYYD